MASVKIHQNIFNYQKKRKGFTQRQIISAVVGLIVMLGIIGGLWFGLGLNYQVAIALGMICAVPCIIAGFTPIFGMNAEEMALRYLKHFGRRGLLLQEKIENIEGGVSRGYLKKARKERGFECVESKAGGKDK